MQQARLRDTAMTFITDYAAVSETTGDLHNAYIKFLHPESRLPHPKEVLRVAFAIILDRMEREHLQRWGGVPKETYLGAARALEEKFAPDEEVLEDPFQNACAFYRRLEKIGALPPFDLAKEDQRIRANPEGWDRIYEIVGLSKEIREIIIKGAIARAEERERKGAFKTEEA